MGIAFKPNIDDLRESPSLFIVRELIAKGIDPIICEPNIKHHKSFKLTICEEAIAQADIIVFLVSHKEFVTAEIPAKKVVIDICGVKSKF
jgi:UDP-N-acetyl-D-mannosaminuronic acid dehydrogenase